MTKYHNRKVVIDGITFDSRKEGNFYCELKMLRMAGEVKDFSLQVFFEGRPGTGRIVISDKYFDSSCQLMALYKIIRVPPCSAS